MITDMEFVEHLGTNASFQLWNRGELLLVAECGDVQYRATPYGARVQFSRPVFGATFLVLHGNALFFRGCATCLLSSAAVAYGSGKFLVMASGSVWVVPGYRELMPFL